MQQRPPVLDNPKAERIRKVAALGGRSFRRKAELILVEGPQAVTELLRHQPENVVDIYVGEEWRGSDLHGLATETTKWVHLVSPRVAATISKNSQGIVAVAKTRSILNAATGPLLTQAEARFAVALPETQDPGNLGTIIRSAAAFGADAVFLGTGSADPTNPKVIRASAGAVFLLPIYRADLAEARRRHGAALVLGTSGADGSKDLNQLVTAAIRETNSSSPLTQSHLWVFGNEARGLSGEDAALCDLLVRIPIEDRVESLNAAAAAAVCLHASSLIAKSKGSEDGH